jgi:hypothetical protein
MPDSRTVSAEQEEVQMDVSIKPRWPIQTDTPLLHANFFAIANSGHEVVLTFGEFLPYIQQPIDEKDRQNLEDSEIKVVSRIAISPAGYKAFFDMLKRNIGSEEEDDVN